MEGNDWSENTPFVVNENLDNSAHLSETNMSEHIHPHSIYQQNISESKHFDEKTITTFSQMSRRSKIILILCTIAQCLSSCAISFIAPLYPIEAEKKGMSVALTGWVFGLFHLLVFLLSPIYGNYITRIGPKFCYVAGIIVRGMCNILFGMLDKSPPGTSFIATSIACRSVEAFGFSGFFTASMAILAHEFPDNIGLVIGILQLGTGVGQMIGPLAGGALYEWGGFGLPFYLIGALIVINGCLICAFLPTVTPTVLKTREKSVFYLLRNPLVIVSFFSILCGDLSKEVFNASFSKHLASFQLSAILVSVFFSGNAFLFAMVATVWGYIADKKFTKAPLIAGGHFVFAISFLILGPSPLLPFMPFELWTEGIGVALQGLCLGCIVTLSITCMLKGASSLGFENNMETNAMVAGLFTAATHLGGFIGPVGGDALIADKGVPLTYTVVAFLQILAMLIQITYIPIRYILKKCRTAEEDQNTMTESMKRKGDLENNISISLALKSYQMSFSISEPR